MSSPSAGRRSALSDLTTDKVLPCWPGEAGVQDARKFVPPEVQAWLDDPSLALLPRAAWPDRPPPSQVRATDEQWEIIVRAGVERGMMCRVADAEVFKDQNGLPVLNGAGGVRKVKHIGGGGEDAAEVHQHPCALQHLPSPYGGR